MERKSNQIACSLSSPELQLRKSTVIAELKRYLMARSSVSNGIIYEFEGTDENLDRLNTFIQAERRCCSFFDFQLTIEAARAALMITGPEGTEQFLSEELGL